MKTKPPSFWVNLEKLNKERGKGLKKLNDERGKSIRKLKWG
jgi:hypothetical protein